MILVTGGTDLADSFIVRELQARGQVVRVLARAASASVAEELGADESQVLTTSRDGTMRLGYTRGRLPACTMQYDARGVGALYVRPGLSRHLSQFAD